MNCIVTDIDGTICEKLPQGSFASWEDRLLKSPPKPNIAMRTLLQAAANGGMWILYATARRAILRAQTGDYLMKNAFPAPARMYMRPDDLRLPQDMLKVRYLKEMREQDWEPSVWFEDDPATIEALRSQGVHAIQC